MPRKTEKTLEAAFAYEGLDRVIHERARLGILTCLMTHAAGLSFAELKRFCSLTDGNLARHLQVLEQDEMVRMTKSERDGKAITMIRIQRAGRERYLRYLAALEQVLKDAARIDVQADPSPHTLTPLKA